MNDGIGGGGYLDLAGKQGDGYITDPDHP
eukprot:COSAG01_NODE_75818_length_192_cov_127.989247_1_plen_28_part_10